MLGEEVHEILLLRINEFRTKFRWTLLEATFCILHINSQVTGEKTT